MGWALDCGVLHAGSDGFAIRPQMKVSLQTSSVRVQAGMDDLRDGLSGAIVAQMQRTYFAEGTSLPEVLQSAQQLCCACLSAEGVISGAAGMMCAGTTQSRCACAN